MDFEQSFMYIDKYIYERPIQIDYKDMELNAHRLPYAMVNDRYIKIDSGGISWIELILAVILFVFLVYTSFISQNIRYHKLVEYYIEFVDKGMHQGDKSERKGLYFEALENNYRKGGIPPQPQRHLCYYILLRMVYG